MEEETITQKAIPEDSIKLKIGVKANSWEISVHGSNHEIMLKELNKIHKKIWEKYGTLGQKFGDFE